MGRIARSWELVKASWAVLLADKELMVFPLLSLVAAGTVVATFLVPMFLAGILDAGVGFAGGLPAAAIVIGFVFYVVQYTIVFYCNSALVGAAMIRLRGGQPSLRDGFRIANERFGAIVGYALIAATVGIILRSISRRGFLARLVAGFLGVAWSIATFLAVPVLVVEGVGPIDAVKRSTQLLKKTWGEQIAGNIGLGAAYSLIVFGILLVFGGALALAVATKSVVLIVGAAGLLVTVLVVLSLIGSALGAIYSAAVYRYATEGEAGGMFAPDLVREAFRPR